VAAPQTFPDGGAHQPDEFPRLLSSLTRDCLRTLDLRDVDCTEYPCVAYAVRKTDAQQKAADVAGCPGWRSARLGTPTVFNDSIPTDGGKLDVTIIVGPQGARPSRALSRRIEDRLTAMCESYGLEDCEAISVPSWTFDHDEPDAGP
jgi:hypothetical protein